jgi:hypothetical protein
MVMSAKEFNHPIQDSINIQTGRTEASVFKDRLESSLASEALEDDTKDALVAALIELKKNNQILSNSELKKIVICFKKGLLDKYSLMEAAKQDKKSVMSIVASALDKESYNFNQFQRPTFFDYNRNNSTTGPGKAPDPKDEPIGAQALRDWNRAMGNYFINGRAIIDINHHQAFKTIGELSVFLETHLLSLIENPNDKRQLLNDCLNHFHQGGLSHATNLIVMNTMAQANADKESSDGIWFSQPDYRVDFVPTKQGVSLRETNLYRKIANCTSHGIRPADGTYYLRTITDTHLSTSGIELTNLNMHCKDARMIKIFDTRNILEQLIDFIKAVFKLNAIPENPAPKNMI